MYSKTILWKDLFLLAQMLKKLGIYKLDRFNINRQEDFHPYLKRLNLYDQ